MITENYDSHTKDELLEEVKRRGIEGVSASNNKADIVAALELNDDEPEPEVTSPLPKPAKSLLPQVSEVPELPRDPNEAPADNEYTDGVFTKDDGLEYAVCIREDAPNGRTHFAKNTRLFWNGTKDEFKAQFEKK